MLEFYMYAVSLKTCWLGSPLKKSKQNDAHLKYIRKQQVRRQLLGVVRTWMQGTKSRGGFTGILSQEERKMSITLLKA